MVERPRKMTPGVFPAESPDRINLPKRGVKEFHVPTRLLERYYNLEELVTLVLYTLDYSLSFRIKRIEGYGNTKAIFCDGVCVGYITMNKKYNGKIKVTIVSEQNTLEVDLIQAFENLLRQFS